MTLVGVCCLEVNGIFGPCQMWGVIRRGRLYVLLFSSTALRVSHLKI